MSVSDHGAFHAQLPLTLSGSFRPLELDVLVADGIDRLFRPYLWCD
jgi:hypothetical protein